MVCHSWLHVSIWCCLTSSGCKSTAEATGHVGAAVVVESLAAGMNTAVSRCVFPHMAMGWAGYDAGVVTCPAVLMRQTAWQMLAGAVM